MPVIQPPAPHYTTQDLDASLRIIIPGRKNWFLILFIGFWLVGWALGEIVVGGMLVAGAVAFFSRLFGLSSYTSQIPGGGVAALLGVGLFMVGWFGMWTIGGFVAIRTFLWQLVGIEVIQVDTQSITVHRQIFNFGRPKIYLAEHIKDMRVAPENNSLFGWPRNLSLWGLMDGSISFDYGAKTFRFGSGTDQAEAKQIVATIREKFSQY